MQLFAPNTSSIHLLHLFVNIPSPQILWLSTASFLYLNSLPVNGGILKPLGNDPERDKDIQRQGADALNAKHAQRRTLSDTLDTLLRKKATPEDIATYNLPADATYQDAIMAAMMQQAAEGNVKAGQFIRDTIGEQPTAKQDLSVSMTDDDKRLLEKVEARLNG